MTDHQAPAALSSAKAWRREPHPYTYVPEDGPSKEGELDLAYNLEGPPFSNIFGSLIERNRVGLARAFRQDLDDLTAILDGLYSLAAHFFPSLNSQMRASVNPATRALFPCFHKGLLSVASCLELTKAGLYGPARPLVRHAFESVVIAKYCSINPASDVFDKWMEGQEIWLTRDVLNKLSSPSTDSMRAFWRTLSSLTHSSVYAGQPLLRIKDEESVWAIFLNLSFVGMLATCLSHLLLSHIATKSVRYYQEQYGDPVARKEVARKTSEMRRRFAHRNFGVEARRLVRDYKAKWVVA